MVETVRWQPLLRDALAVLAADADDQILANGPGCIACDLPEEFGHARTVAIEHAPLTQTQRESLDAIDARLRAMSEFDLECGNDDVLLRPAWESLRNVAMRALSEFGWEGLRPAKSVETQPGVWKREFSTMPTERNFRIVDGDLLDQDVEVIVNAWNRNVIPWWLLIPQGVSGAIKRRGGREPFRELGRMGAIPLGGAVVTGPGKLPFQAIIHVAGINLLWRSSERSVRDSVRNAMQLVVERGYSSVAFPLIGAGSGGGKAARVQAWMEHELSGIDFACEVLIVRYERGASRGT